MPKRAEPPCLRRSRIDDAARMSDLLRSQILSDAYGAGALPSEAELMLEYAVGRNVTREALDRLRSEGLIERIQGSGTFVLAIKARHRFDRVHGLRDSVAGARTVTGEVIAMETAIAPGPVAQLLRLEPGTSCLWLRYLATVDDTVLSVSTSYLPPDVGARITAADFNGDFYALLESAGFEVGRSDLVVEAIAADSLAASLLSVDTGAPLMMFRRKLFDRVDRPLEVGFVRCPGYQVSLDIQLSREHQEASP
jgi:GntR family transcriptional regulator